MGYDHALTDGEKRELLRIARCALREHFLSGRRPPGAPHSAALTACAGLFVSLHRGLELRGCIGTFAEKTPLYQAVQEMAVSAALRDPRFDPLLPDELAMIAIEISVLSGLQRLGSPAEIRIGHHGVHIMHGHFRGVLLPQVAAEHGWDPEELLSQTCRKAGIHAEGWRDPEALVQIFSAQVFCERDFQNGMEPTLP